MQVVTIPATIEKAEVPTFLNGKQIGVTAKNLTFAGFLGDALRAHDMFRKGAANARLYGKLMTALENVTADQKEISFEDGDFKVLKDAVANAAWSSSDLNRLFIPFYDAIDAAKSSGV